MRPYIYGPDTHGNKEDIVIILAHEDILEVANFTLRVVCRILAGVRPDWRPIIKSALVRAELVAQLHNFQFMVLQAAYQSILALVQSQTQLRFVWYRKAHASVLCLGLEWSRRTLCL